MNIFYLNKDPKLCAEQHIDKHCVKMILEYAQLLSTAHRILDGTETIEPNPNGRMMRRWKFEDERKENLLYLASHVNHPSGNWCRENVENYTWLATLLKELCQEYTHRYGKVHSTQQRGLMDYLYNNLPQNISNGKFTEPPPCMPPKYKVMNDSIQSYFNYYVNDKQPFAKWTKRFVPDWYVNLIKEDNEIILSKTFIKNLNADRNYVEVIA